MQIIHIEFIDTTIDSEWHSEEEINGLTSNGTVIEACGFLVKETDEFIALAPIVDINSKAGMCKGLIQVPVGAICKRTVLSKSKKK